MSVGNRDYLPRLQTLLVFLILNGMAKTKLAILPFLSCGEIMKNAIGLSQRELCEGKLEWKEQVVFYLKMLLIVDWRGARETRVKINVISVEFRVCLFRQINTPKPSHSL